MPFPPAERVIFDHNPLDQVVTALQFPPILQIATEEPADFQGHIRADYPLYTREDSIAVPAELEAVFSKLGRPPQSVRHTFRTADQKQAAFLTREFVAYEDRDYTRWERFESEVQRVVQAMFEVYKPVFFTRVGLRYVNIIKRSALDLSAETPWKDLVKPTFIGLLGLDEYRERIKESASVSTLRLDDVPGGSVRIQHGLRPPAAESEPEEVYFIDADFFTEERTNVADALNWLSAFHAHSGNLFRWVITDTLYKALRPRRLDAASGSRPLGRAAGG
jgi:uncharacterized protein (TIGR04255 family)